MAFYLKSIILISLFHSILKLYRVILTSYKTGILIPERAYI